MRRRAERSRRGFVSRVMVQPYALVGIALGLIVAIVVGINLGNASVKGINPIHFRPVTAFEPRVPVLDEAPPAPLARRLPSYSELYSWEDGRAAIEQECGPPCGGSATYSASVPYFGSREEIEAAQRRAMRVIDRDFAEETADAMNRRVRERIEEAPAVVNVAAPSPVEGAAALSLPQE
ncbi:hypothetical protein RCO27_18365 [Sphingosinicella sp. LHD-64]|uniref:hypothetical protein n=1 Tax=Sphingosinicella sp. LHD-64 TaxID=3072139 RepID=UPI00280EC17A|nr:hypothetical protein [Sphingosinicella sp. LHD-64]MDQ8758196.1 hypothetical protein [Sphingosinicella sp. LHD-64]